MAWPGPGRNHDEVRSSGPIGPQKVLPTSTQRITYGPPLTMGTVGPFHQFGQLHAFGQAIVDRAILRMQ